MVKWIHFICIPCFKCIVYLLKTLESIYVDNADIPLDKFEVFLSDGDSD